MTFSVPAVYYRGGSSKAVFFHEENIPPAGATRDRFLKRVIGTPDPIQIDGMGGSRVVTSKVAIVKASERPDADVDYTFAQICITEDYVGYEGNCGNISAAVGPFAISEGLVKERRVCVGLMEGMKTQEDRIYNTGTRIVLCSHVPVDENGTVVESGDFSIAAVPGTGAPILMDYGKTVSAAKGKGIPPTSLATDKVEIDGNPILWVSPSTFRIHYSLGVMPVAVIVEGGQGNKETPVFRTLSFIRTARRIMTCSVHIPDELVRELKTDLPGATESIAQMSTPPTAQLDAEKITEAFCEFVANTTFDSCLSGLVPKLSDLLIDHIGVAAAAAQRGESSNTFLQAIRLIVGTTGQNTVYTEGRSFTPQYAALLNGAFAHTFDFDDTMAEAVLHPGAAITPAALAEAEVSQGAAITWP